MINTVDIIMKSEWWMLTHKLSRFRRHPDWVAALKKVAAKFETILPDGSKAIHDRDVEMIFEMADEEFVDEIIRRGG